MNREYSILPIATEEAACAAQALYGLRGVAQVLASERDQTLRLAAADGAVYVLKISHPEVPAEVARFQLGALRHLAAHAPALPVPRVVPTGTGAAFARHRYADGSRRLTSLLTWLPGATLHTASPGAAQAVALGEFMARLALGLRSYPAQDKAQAQLWDITHALNIRPLLDQAEPALQSLVRPVLEEFAAATRPGLDALAWQVIHNDCNPHNVLVDAQDGARISGLIDFGDLVCAPRVNDLAIALSYRIPVAAARATIADLLRGYEAVTPLAPPERALLPGLIRARMAMSVTISAWRARMAPENAAYLLRYHHGARACLEALHGQPPARVQAMLCPG